MMIDNEHFNIIDNVETMKKNIEAIQKEIFNKMAVPKEAFQVKTFTIGNIRKIQKVVAEAQKKQTLTYKIKNFFKNILKFKK